MFVTVPDPLIGWWLLTLSPSEKMEEPDSRYALSGSVRTSAPVAEPTAGERGGERGSDVNAGFAISISPYATHARLRAPTRTGHERPQERTSHYGRATPLYNIYYSIIHVVTCTASYPAGRLRAKVYIKETGQ